jgi:hypothetical protein
MMKSCGIGWGALLMPLALPVFVPTSSFESEQVDELPPVITITMKDCPVSEPGTKTTEPRLVQLATATLEAVPKGGEALYNGVCQPSDTPAT